MFASASTTVKIHELPSGNVIHNYQPGIQTPGPIRSISWSKDGKWLALVPYSGQTEIISVKNEPKLIHTIGLIQEPSCAAFQTNSKKIIAIGTQKGEVFLYDIKAKNIKKSFPKTNSFVKKISFTEKDAHVVAACENGEAFVFSNVHNTLSACFKVPRSQSISALNTHPIKKNLVAAGSDEGVVVVWDIHTNKNKFFIGSHKAPVTSLAFSPVTSDLLVSTGLDRQFCVYDISKWICIGSIFVEISMSAVEFTLDGKLVIMATQKGKIEIYEVNNFQQPILTFSAHAGAIDHLAFRKSDDREASLIISKDQDKEVPTATTESSFDFNIFANEIESVASSPKNESGEKSLQDSFSFSIDNNDRGEVLFKKNLECTEKRTQALSLKEISVARTTSTPVLTSDNTAKLRTPTLTPKHVNSESLRNIIREEVKSVCGDMLKKVSEDLKYEIQYSAFCNLNEIRLLILNSLMAQVKDGVKEEERFNLLKSALDDIGSVVNLDQNHVSEENMLLKQEIEKLRLENQLLKMNYN